MLHVDWTTLFKTVGLCKARIARSLKHERLVPVEPEENPMPEGSVMGHENAEEYLRSVHETHMNNADPDLYVIHEDVEANVDGFVQSMDPETSSAGTGPFEVPSSDDLKQLSL